MTNPLQPPEPKKSDAGYAVAKGVVGSLPLVGAIGAELFGLLIQEPYEKRSREWMTAVGDALAELRDNGRISAEALRNDPAFTDTVIAATQIAIRTHNEDKRKALHNAILNSALPSAPDESIRQWFLRLVDEFTARHLQLLDLFDDPVAWQDRHNCKIPKLEMGGLSHIIRHAYPGMQRGLYDQWWRDLYARGLVSPDTLHTTRTGRSLTDSQTTPLGKQFLGFIRAPSGS